MFNNFMQYEYQPYHKIYVNEASVRGIYLGDVSSALDMDFIRNQPIHVVVTAAAGMDQVSYPNGEVKHVIYPLMDAKSQNISKFFHEFFDLVESQIHHSNILVHCAAGISRSATLVISYFMKKNKWSFKEAVKFVRDKRPIILPNLGFERQLKEFQISLGRDSHTSDFDRKFLPSVNDDRKNMFSPIRRDLLPDLKNLGQTSFMRGKALEKNINLRLDSDYIREMAHRKYEGRMRKSQPDSKGGIKKKPVHLSDFNKEIIFAKLESGRSKLLQRSNNNVYVNFPTDNSTFYQDSGIKVKKLSSLSHRSQKMSRQRKLVRNYSNSKHRRENNQFEEMNRVIVSKLHLNQRKFATQKHLRTRGVQRLAQL